SARGGQRRSSGATGPVRHVELVARGVEWRGLASRAWRVAIVSWRSSGPIRFLMSLAVALVAAGCDRLPALPANPFTVTPTLMPTPVPTPTAVPTVVPTAMPVPFRAFWVKNFRQTEMWSGPGGAAGVVSF